MNLEDTLKLLPSDEHPELLWDEKHWTLTTECLTCHKEWSRKVYGGELCGFQCWLDCPECHVGEFITLVGNNKTWLSVSGVMPENK